MEKVLKALGNQKRLEIIWYLKQKKEANVGSISEEIKITFKATSKHLAILSANNILGKNKRGLGVFYFLSQEQNPIAKYIISQI